MTTMLQTPATAPKDGTTILADFQGHSFMPAVWCPSECQWAIADQQLDFVGDKLQKVVFENGYEEHSNMMGWLPMPKMEVHEAG